MFQLVVNLGIVVYHALDYTHAEDEERSMSPDLENLITEMTAGNVAGIPSSSLHRCIFNGVKPTDPGFGKKTAASTTSRDELTFVR